MKYLLKLSFLGTGFCGFQVQENGDTVQGRLCRAAETVFGVDCTVTGCSRTDSGVHALEYYATLAETGGSDIPAEKLPRALNTYLPKEITVTGASAVSDDYSIRRAVRGKEYMYLIYSGKYESPFYFDRSLYYPHDLDVCKMNAAAAGLIGKHDFSAFMAAGSEISGTVRTITDCHVLREGDFVKIFVSADGFLYNMVRIITGTLLEVSEGKIAPENIAGIIESKNRTLAGRTAQPQGLYLSRVFF